MGVAIIKWDGGEVEGGGGGWEEDEDEDEAEEEREISYERKRTHIFSNFFKKNCNYDFSLFPSHIPLQDFYIQE